MTSTTTERAPRRGTIPLYGNTSLIELAVLSGLVPEHWRDPYKGPGWWCWSCGGTTRVVSRSKPRRARACRACTVASRPGALDAPLLAHDLHVVAELGLKTLREAETLAGRVSGARVVWRALADVRAELRLIAGGNVIHGGPPPDTVAFVCAVETLGQAVTSIPWRESFDPREAGGARPWPETCPWLSLPERDPARLAWSDLRALARLGLTPVGFTPRPDGRPDLTLAVSTSSQGAMR